jgi:hypothetical protein
MRRSSTRSNRAARVCSVSSRELGVSDRYPATSSRQQHTQRFTMLRQFRPRRGATITVATVGALAAVGGVSVATGAIPGADGKINACYSNGDGTVRIVDEGKSCSKNFVPISWNQQGPAGVPGRDGADGQDGQDGAPGERGLRGPSNVYGTFKDAVSDLPDSFDNYGIFNFGREPIVTLSLPAGSFHIQAKGFANGEAGNVGCVLVAGQNIDGSLASLPGDRTVEPLVMQVLHHFTEPGQVELRCTDYGETVRGLHWIKVHATQVESISNPPAP